MTFSTYCLRSSNGAETPSSSPPSSYSPQLTLPPHNAPAALPASDTGIFGGLPAHPGDLVDNLTRSGSFSFLSELFDTTRLLELRDFRITRVIPKGETIQQFAACMHLVLDLADKYPRDSLVAHILDCVAKFFPTLLCPCTRRGRVRQIISSAERSVGSCSAFSVERN